MDERRFCARRKRKRRSWLILAHFYITINLEMGRDYMSLPDSTEL
jgi:hypothetical protein